MGVVSLLVFFTLLYPVLPYSAEEPNMFFSNNCPPFYCGELGKIQCPFTNTTNPTHCGPFWLDDCDKEHQMIPLLWGAGRWYDLNSIIQVKVKHQGYQRHLNSSPCKSFNNLSLSSLPYTSIQIMSNLTLYKCNHNVSIPSYFDFSSTGCRNLSVYYTSKEKSLPPKCSIVSSNLSKSYHDIFGLLTAKLALDCVGCLLQGHQCQLNNDGNVQCVDPKEGASIRTHWTRPRGGNKLALKLGLALGLGAPAAIMIYLFPIIFIRRQYKRKYTSSSLLPGSATSNSSSKSDLEGGNVFFGVPIFSYSELEEATNNFDSKRELGDGGFGTVYYGILRDTREVAIKRLYGHNYRKVEQFMNEIIILTRLRHKNLVSLYGCTSRHSHELLLVYEYIPNGTLADHLQGNQAKSGPLIWPIRMRIAIETASALAYLHASDIIHRDVKTNNILLDNNFCVKVADFGLSRLFPSDISHVSTVPLGTPGYIDPEYHQCYQLSAKSDVYSFGVVLIELISSMPAIDKTRHRHEINLANLAVNKIQKCLIRELIDPCLGYKSDDGVKRMTTSVAELAFQCLQQDKELRPSMEDVLEELKQIERREHKLENVEEKCNDNEALKSTEASASEFK